MKKTMTLTAMIITTVMGMTTPTLANTNTYKAIPTGQTVTLNGNKVNFAAYNINGNNYFKLRDLAAAMDGTEKNFNVDYNKVKDSVEITSMTPYTTGNVGISGYSKKGDQKATNSPQSIYLDDELVTLQAYAVLDYNYCKLRDVADLLDFAVDWNPNTNTVNIGTDRGVDDSVTLEKEPVVNPNPNLDVSTQQAVKDIVDVIGPSGKSHWTIQGHYDESDWNQLINNPYSSDTLSIFFDSYKQHGDIETFKGDVAGWLRNGGDDGVAHMEVFG